MSEINTKDALGNDVIVGQVYGYSVDNNGNTSTTIGKAVKLTESGKYTLEVISTKSALWMDEAEPNKWRTAKKVSVKPAKLFPVNPDNIK
jgi:hypothetical protein